MLVKALNRPQFKPHVLAEVIGAVGLLGAVRDISDPHYWDAAGFYGSAPRPATTSTITMPKYVAQGVVMALNGRGLSVNGRRILLLGLSYKKNTRAARESPSIHVADRLEHLGGGDAAVDPHVHPDQVPSGVERIELTDDELRTADLVVVLVDHDAFDMTRVGELAPYVLDTRNCTPRRANVEGL